jgi:hypothetical protein
MFYVVRYVMEVDNSLLRRVSWTSPELKYGVSVKALVDVFLDVAFESSNVI